MRTRFFSLSLALLLAFTLVLPAQAGRRLDTSNGQTVYVPVYSHIYHGVKNRPYNLSAMLSIRNVDFKRSITVKSIKYFNSDGKVVKSYLTEPLVLGPMATFEVHIPERDTSGGSGANFTVQWVSDKEVSVPIVQSVMIGTASTLGISFVCDGVAVEEEE